MGQRVLTIIIGGDSKGGQKAMADTEKSAGGLGSKLGTLATVGAGAFVAVGAAAVGFAAKSADTFSRVGGEVLKLQRYTGATAEDASRLRFAGEEAGLGVDDMTKSLGLLSKGLATTKFDKLGLDLKDASGKARPLNDDLLKIASRFETMPNGAEKTALAMQLFGKSGAAMIPFLNRGAEGIRELEKESDKYGTTLNTKDLAAVKASTANHRLFSAAMEGLQIQVGRYVLPIMTQFTSFLATNMPTAINGVRAAMEFLSPVFQLVGKAISDAVADFTLFWNALTTGFTADEGTPIERVALRIRDAFSAVADWFQQNWPQIQQTVSGVISAITQVISVNVAVIEAVWNIFGDNILSAIQRVWPPIQQVVTGVMTAIHGIIQTITSLIHGDWSGAWEGIQQIFSGVWNAMLGLVKVVFEEIRLGISIALDAIGALWSGAWAGLKAVASGAWDSIKNTVTGGINGVVSFIAGMPGRIASAAHGMWNGIVADFKAALNAVISAWNSFGIPSFHVHITMPSVIPNIDFDTPRINFPDIPYLATGGIVRQTFGGMLARIGEGSSNEAVLPLNADGVRPLTDGIVARLQSLAGAERSTYASARPLVVQIDLSGAYVMQGVEHLAQTIQQQLEQINLRNYGVGLGVGI